MTSMNEPSSKPRTLREIQAQKKKAREADNNKIRIRNKTRLQNIPIQLHGKKTAKIKDPTKAIYQISIQIGPGKHVDLPEYRLIPEQIATLKKRGMIATTKIGPSANKIKDVDYKKFASDVSVEPKASPVASGKSKTKSKSSKTTKSDD